MPSKKKYNARFAPARIKKIMQTDEEVGKVSAAVPVIISKCLEMFLDSLLNKANYLTLQRNAKTLTVEHLKQVILSDNRYDFLKDLIVNIPDMEEEEDEAQPKKKRRIPGPANGASEPSKSDAMDSSSIPDTLRATGNKEDTAPSSNTSSSHSNSPFSIESLMATPKAEDVFPNMPRLPPHNDEET